MSGPLLRLDVQRVSARLAYPFRISGYVFEAMPALLTTISDATAAGRGEAAGVYYLGDDQDHMASAVESVREAIESGIDRRELQTLLRPCGARNALDCALWELEARRTATPAWKLAGIRAPAPLVTTFTLPADDPAAIANHLADMPFARAIKLKLDGHLDADRERLRIVRQHRPDTWLMVDANQGYGGDGLDGLETALVDHDVKVLEQPVPRGDEQLLSGWRPPFLLAADESILDLLELADRGDYFDMINIKLDKCGGLTEALAMARLAAAAGKKLMVGNMAGSTLAMAPAFVVAQLCDVADLDGPFGLADDPLASQIYSEGEIFVPERLWGFDEEQGAKERSTASRT